MTSAALPPLPSIRAKELERASANRSNVDLAQTSNVLSQSQNQVSEQSVQSAFISSTDLRRSSSLNVPPQSEAQRSGQLAMLHQKEQNVFGGLPPLESSVACNAIHQYISTTSSFLNSFIADANASNDGINNKLNVLEKQMALLESKIASMPDLFPEEDEFIEEEDGKNAEKTCDESQMESENGEESKSVK
eukprot:CAMPEP_0172319938 /NCGR_PEP_ID=MMETSP1058-20130122/39115_1 /TAXON_ID=83371 /ORGANISM="Detonula confervacea, Strain CCMP 353" /LENGTH=190 /DNA_ID=CAMNT_0013035087 /DNA_START=103 /DNA_END=675 /DNA_ORIENTATION=+